jgi:exonuclease III
MRERNISILAVQETHLTDELAEQFENLFGNTTTIHYSPDPNTRNARGVALLLHKRAVRTDEAKTTTLIPGRAMVTKIPWQDDQTINILTIYAPNAPRETKDFWNEINAKINASPDLSPDVMLGDFNLVEDALDRLPSKPDDQNATEALREFRNHHNLVDGWRKANPNTKNYTWSRESDGTQSRIDRIYVREEFFPDCKGWDINTPPIPTDHDLISARISTPSTPIIGRGRWAIPTRIFKHKATKDELQKLGLELERKLSTTQARTPQENPQIWLKDFKTKVRDIALRHEKAAQPRIKRKIAKLSDTLHALRNN